MEDKINILCVIVGDIDFEPVSNDPIIITMQSTDAVEDLVEATKRKAGAKRQYDTWDFRDPHQVLRILKPVSIYDYEAASKTAHGSGEVLSLSSILQHLREQSREANKTELANEYVKVLHSAEDIGHYFKHEERGLISAILVRMTTTGESPLVVASREVSFDTSLS